MEQSISRSLGSLIQFASCHPTDWPFWHSHTHTHAHRIHTFWNGHCFRQQYIICQNRKRAGDCASGPALFALFLKNAVHFTLIRRDVSRVLRKSLAQLMLLTWHCAELSWAAAGIRENRSWWMGSLWFSRLWAHSHGHTKKKLFDLMAGTSIVKWIATTMRVGRERRKKIARNRNYICDVGFQSKWVNSAARTPQTWAWAASAKTKHPDNYPDPNNNERYNVTFVYFLSLNAHFLPTWVRSCEFVPNKSALSTRRLLLCSACHCLFVCVFFSTFAKMFRVPCHFWCWKFSGSTVVVGKVVRVSSSIKWKIIFRLLHVQLSWFHSISHLLCRTGAIRVCFLSFLPLALDHFPALLSSRTQSEWMNFNRGNNSIWSTMAEKSFHGSLAFWHVFREWNPFANFSQLPATNWAKL